MPECAESTTRVTIEEILIIDDSQQICAMLAEYVLPELGYSSAIANTGRQGLNRLRQKLPDLILLDLQLPDISGLDLLRLIAQEGYDVPVILMTAHGSEGIAVEAFRLGARNYLIKPFSETEAQVVIDQALRERRLKREKEQLTQHLQQRVKELTVLYSIGQSVSSLLDLEELLVRIVEAAVYITRAEEGFLLLKDPNADELYLRAARNLGEQRAQRMRMPIEDTLAVDNQQSERTFSENDQYLLSALADYAAIAIDNARLYQEVKGSEERYRDLFANAYDLIFTLDRQLRILSINKVGSALTGYAEEQLRGRPLREIAAADAWDEAEPRFADLLMGRAIQPFELQLRRHDDERVLLEVSARLVNDRGTARSIHCIARNLTERRRLEEQLIHSEKLSAIGQLVAGVAHELNNPLTSISGYTQLMLRDTGLRDDVRSDLKHINIQAERAARIVQNLLVFAREHKPERRMVNLNEEFRNTLSLRAYQLRVDNITVLNQVEPELPLTVADPFQIQQVMLNLINNAHQAMTERGGPGTLTLRTFVTPLPAADNGTTTPPMVVMSVGDNGVGIPARDLKRIFDPFFTTKPVGQGTGLGLSICFGIVQEHGGRIWAESELEVGTTVYVALPLMHDLEALDGETVADGGAEEAEARVSSRVLVVDDEEPVANLLARLLRELGHQPTVVNSGTEALELIAREQFDLILSDVKMPGMSGFELHQTIKQTNPELAARLVFVTGDMLSAATQARIAQSGNPYIAKPFAIERLETLVRALLSQRPIEQQ